MPEAEQVELDELERLDVALVELDDDAAGHRGPLQRRDVDERRGGHEHAARRGWRGGAGSRRSGRTAPASAPRARGRRRCRRAAAAGLRGDRAAVGGLGPARSGPMRRPAACVRPRAADRSSGRARGPRRSLGAVAAGSPGRTAAGPPDRVRRLAAEPGDARGVSPGPPSSSGRAVRCPARGAGAAGVPRWSSWPMPSRRAHAARRAPRRAPPTATAVRGPHPARRKNSAKPPSASRSRRTITESYVSSALATRSTSGRGKPSA